MEFIWKNSFNPQKELLSHVLYYHYSTMEYDLLKKNMYPNIGDKKESFLR